MRRRMMACTRGGAAGGDAPGLADRAPAWVGPAQPPPAPAATPDLHAMMAQILAAIGEMRHAPAPLPAPAPKGVHQSFAPAPEPQGQPAAVALEVQPPPVHVAAQPDLEDGKMPLREQKILGIFQRLAPEIFSGEIREDAHEAAAQARDREEESQTGSVPQQPVGPSQPPPAPAAAPDLHAMMAQILAAIREMRQTPFPTPAPAPRAPAGSAGRSGTRGSAATSSCGCPTRLRGSRNTTVRAEDARGIPECPRRGRGAIVLAPPTPTPVSAVPSPARSSGLDQDCRDSRQGTRGRAREGRSGGRSDAPGRDA
ncbi:predicted GPI-anchored protein 58 [Solanum tuberosum]|uniref:predicted GPI-anchored protein 58 n=1 Tax=Solanum tuberosum TaxID=4113 RepID=UPI00073A1419|nr:PREDICTED: predicted GPI-anchored protein 58 [Solanum tuberosum]